MTLRRRHPASGDRERLLEPGPYESRRDGIAVSPGLGPVPAIYVPQRRARAGHVPRGEPVTDTPADLRYSSDHLWARALANGSGVRVGVTDFAQQSLGDIVDVSPPRLGDTVTAGEPCGEIESTKSVNDLVAPVTGTVRARHDDLADSPELVNSDPYGEGWMFEVETDPATLDQQLAALMDARAYTEMVGA